MCSLICLFVALVSSHLGSRALRTLVLIVSVPGHCLPFTFYSTQQGRSKFRITHKKHTVFLYFTPQGY